MQAFEIMTRPVVSVHAKTPVHEAIATLYSRDLPALPVVNDRLRVLGVFTEVEASAGEAAIGAGAEEPTVDAVMTTAAEIASPDTEFAVLARRILADRLRCIVIVADDALFGIVTRRDLLRPPVRNDDTIASVITALHFEPTLIDDDGR